MGRDRLWRCAIVPATLLVVAAIHTYHFARFDRSSWGSGCGFGMFATLDAHGTRFFRCHVVIRGQRYPASFEGSMEKDALKVRMFPTPASLQRLARSLAGQSWRLVRYRDSDSSDSSAAGDDGVRVEATCSMERWLTRHGEREIVELTSVSVDTLELELWGLRLDLNQRRIDGYPKQQVSVAAAGIACRGPQP